MPVENSASRRQFLQGSLAVAATPYWWTSSSLGASAAAVSDRPVFAAIGVGGQGSNIANQAAGLGRMVAAADVDTAHAARFAQMVQRNHTQKVETVEDYRRLLDRKDIDAVTIGTPDHWHTKIVIEAMQSGKDVYCEKPLTLTIDEGKLICKVARDTKRVVQVGTQQRSSRQFSEAIALVRAGRLGDLKRVVVGINQAPYSETIPTAEPPSTLNWDMWLGQAPAVEYRFGKGVKRWYSQKSGGDGGEDASNGHYEFRWWYAYSGGKLTDWGAHHMDICQWLIDQNGDGQGPTLITPTLVEHHVEFDDQGNPKRDDLYSVATRFAFQIDFPNGVEVNLTSESRNGLLVEGTKGRLFVSRGGVSGAPVEELKDNPLPKGAVDEVHGKGRPWDHMKDFVNCIRTRETPISDVFTHHRAITTCHLAGIAARLNRPVAWDATSEQVTGDPIAQAMQKREQRKGYEIVV